MQLWFVGALTLSHLWRCVDHQVRNLMLGKAATERLVKECWVAKQRTAEKVALADFFPLFLRKQYPAPGAALEMAYNIVGAWYRPVLVSAACARTRADSARRMLVGLP